MTKLVKRFVEEYKAILDMKKAYNFNNYIAKPIKNTFYSVVILTAVLAGAGYLFSLYKNIHYVLIAFNTIVVCSFVIYKATKELQFMNQFKITYKLWTPVLLDIIYILAIIFTLYSGITLLLFKEVFNAIFITLTIVFGLMFNILYYNLSEGLRIKYKIKNKRTNIFLFSLWLFLLHLVLFFMIDIKNISLAFTINSLIILALLLVKKIFNRIYLNNRENVYSILALLSVFLIIYVARTGLTSERENIFVEKQLNQVEVVLEGDVELCYHKDIVYYQQDNALHILNSDLEEIDVIEPDIDNILRYFYDFEDHLKVVILSDDQTGISDRHIDYYHRYELYDISNIDNPMLEKTFVINTFNYIELLPYDNEYILFEHQFYYSNYYTTDYDIIVFDNDEILYQDNHKIAYIKDSILHYINSNESIHSFGNPYTFYNNGKYIINGEDSETINIVDFDDYLNDDTDSGVIIEGVNRSNIKYFLFDGEYYYISFYPLYGNNDLFSENYFYIYNHKGKLIQEMITYDDSVFFTDTGFYTRVDRDGETDIKIVSLDSNNLISYNVIATSKTFDANSFIILFTLLIFMPDVVFIIRRSGRYA
ncbi:hypothetical protein ACAG96_06835 [Candidatus Izemoplasma sp. B36]|uniref:hypothetical protein n=1 Tax=Candidatus Izemoplasma sp. B36 TaxID=3242468 RepID=UPI003557240B